MAIWVDELIDGPSAGTLACIDPDGRRVSYGDLRRYSAEIETELRAIGVRPGDRVMLVCENSAAYVATTIAAARIRAWIVPVNARHTAQELENLRNHCGARVTIFTPGAEIHGLAAQKIVDLDCSAIADVTPEPISDDPAKQVAALLYTTGTTSAPKGVMLTHRNLTWNAETSARLRHYTAAEDVVGVLPGSHIFGFASTMLATLHIGASIRFLPRFSPKAVLEAFATGATAMPAVPQMYSRLLAHLDATGERVVAPKLRYLSAGGSPLDPDVKAQVEARFGVALNNGYGITETSPTISATRPDAPRDDISVGTALWGVTVTVDKPDADGIGELLVEGPGVMAGYYRNRDATSQALPRAGLFRTGDLGRIDPDGTIWVDGRKKELIIRSGFNVFPPEIEGMLTRHPKISQAAVIGRRVQGNEEILAFVLGDVHANELKDWLRERLVAYKLPQHIFSVLDFPTAPTGKILKHKLAHHFADLIAARDTELEVQ